MLAPLICLAGSLAMAAGVAAWFGFREYSGYGRLAGWPLAVFGLCVLDAVLALAALRRRDAQAVEHFHAQLGWDRPGRRVRWAISVGVTILIACLLVRGAPTVVRLFGLTALALLLYLVMRLLPTGLRGRLLRKPWLRRVAGLWSVAAINAALALAGVEGVMVLAGVELKGSQGQWWYEIPEPMTRFRVSPGRQHFDFTLNRGGFNDVEHPPLPPPGACRVLFIGDSQTFGATPYETVFVTRVGQRLNEPACRPRLAQAGFQQVEVINMGVPGYGTANEYALLRLEGLKLQPHWVVQVLFVGNDLTDSHPEEVEAVLAGRPLAKARDWDVEWLARVLDIRQWRLYAFYNRHRRLGRALMKGEMPTRDNYETHPTFQPEYFLDLQARRTRVLHAAFYQTDQWRAITRLIQATQALVQQAGARFLLVLLPDQNQVDEALLRQVAAHPKAAGHPLDVELPMKETTAFCRQHGIDVIDLLPAFRAQTEPLYLVRDSHLNTAGNRVAAQVIAREILSRLAGPSTQTRVPKDAAEQASPLRNP